MNTRFENILYKGAIVNIQIGGIKKLMKCMEDINVGYTSRISVVDLLSNKCIIYTPTRTVVSHHAELFEDLVYSIPDYSFYITHNRYIPKKTPILIVENVNGNLPYLETEYPYPIFMKVEGQLHYVKDGDGYPVKIAYQDKSIKVIDEDGNWTIIIPQLDLNEPLWKHPGCIITSQIPNKYYDLTLICENDA